jgi:hypothetical protein
MNAPGGRKLHQAYCGGLSDFVIMEDSKTVTEL